MPLVENSSPPTAPATFRGQQSTTVRHRLRWRWFLLLAVVACSFGFGYYDATSPPPARNLDRERALRFADEAARHAHKLNWRDAHLAAARARHADPSLPGMELLIGQMLYNAGYVSQASAYARAAQTRGDSLSASSILLGLEAWARRGGDVISRANAGMVTRLWMEQAAGENLSEGAPRYFLAELDRLTGHDSAAEKMVSALHRFQPWESSMILDAKMHLAAAEAGAQFNAAHFGRGLRLESSVQSLAVRGLRRMSGVGTDYTQGANELAAAFSESHTRILLRDSALERAADPPQ